MRKSAVTLLAGLLAGALCSNAAASPWARGNGRLFVSSKADYFVAQADAPLPGASLPERFERINSDIYVEYGLTGDFTIGGKIIYGDVTFYDGFKSSAVGGFAEIEAYAQYEVFRRRKDALSLKLTGVTPTRFEDGGRPGVLSDGVDAEFRLLYGRSLLRRPFPVYAALEASYRRRFGDAADQIRADALIGVQPLKNALLLVEILSTRSLRNDDPGGADYDVVRIQPSAVWRFSKRYALQAGLAHEAFGRNLLLGNGYFLALWTEF